MRNGSVDGTVQRILDTNVLVYWLDPGNAAKQVRAHQVMQRASTVYGTGLTSQILAEFAHTTTRLRGPILSHAEASPRLNTFRGVLWCSP